MSTLEDFAADEFIKAIARADAMLKELPEHQVLGILTLLKTGCGSYIAQQLLLAHTHALDVIDQAEKAAYYRVVPGNC